MEFRTFSGMKGVGGGGRNPSTPPVQSLFVFTRLHASGWGSLTHDDDGVPTAAGEIRHVVQGTEDGSRQGGAHLRTEPLVGGHPQAPVACVSPREDLIVWKHGQSSQVGSVNANVLFSLRCVQMPLNVTQRQ